MRHQFPEYGRAPLAHEELFWFFGSRPDVIAGWQRERGVRVIRADPSPSDLRIDCYLPGSVRVWSRSLDNLSVSRSGKSSGELSSMMIRNPMVRNSFELRLICRTSQE